MNTKYPTNGKYTTLVDLVHEYARYSSWPSIISANGKQTYYWDKDKQMPFNELVFNGGNSENGVQPYELVWFDDVYSNNEKDFSTNRMKIIQAGDSSTFSAGREVRALEIVNNTSLLTYGIPFRFVIGTTDSDSERFYFNYKTLNGESTAMYALRFIISSFSDKENAKKFLFGSGISNYDALDLSQYNISLENCSIINKNETETVNDNIITKIHYSLFTYNVYNNFDKDYIKDEEKIRIDKYFYEGYHDDNPGIFEKKEDLILSKYAYLNLGENIWTKEHVQYTNYSSNTLPDNQDIKIPYTQDLTQLLDSIYYIINGCTDNFVIDNNPNNYKYNQNIDNPYKIYYYSTIFLNSQRFFYSFVTAIKFSRISTISYAQSQPVLRCDLGLFQTIESFTIISAEHDPETALSPGPLNEYTTIRINIKYQVKYVEIAKIYTEMYSLMFSLGTLNNWTITDNNSPELKNWVRCYYPGKTISADKTDINDGEKYTLYTDTTYTQNFLHIAENKNVLINNVTTDGSLGILKWPQDGMNLEVDSMKKLERIKGKITDSNSYADSFDINTYNNLSNYDKISPMGSLRIHTVFDMSSDVNTLNSSYYIDVSILRCKNYYFHKDEASEDDTKQLLLTYNEPVYNTGNNRQRIEPNTTIDVLLLNTEDANNMEQNLLNTNKSISEYLNTQYFNSSYYYIPINDDKKLNFYLYLKNSVGEYNYYASGAKELLSQGIETEKYNDSNDITNNKITIYTLDSGVFINNTTAFNITQPTTNNAKPIFNIISNININCEYLKITIEDIGNTYYIRTSSNELITNNIIRLTALDTVDYTFVNNPGDEYNKYKLHNATGLNILLYTRNSNRFVLNKTISLNNVNVTNTNELYTINQNLSLKITSNTNTDAQYGLNYDGDNIPYYYALPEYNTDTIEIAYIFGQKNNIFKDVLSINNQYNTNLSYYIGLEPLYGIYFKGNFNISSFNIYTIYGNKEVQKTQYNNSIIMLSLHNTPYILISELGTNANDLIITNGRINNDKIYLASQAITVIQKRT